MWQPPVTIEAALLLALAAKPGHGKALLKQLQQCAGTYPMRMAEGGVYEHLHSLEERGLAIRALPSESRRRAGRPPIRYILTLEGQLRAREHRLFLKRLLGMAPEGEGP